MPAFSADPTDEVPIDDDKLPAPLRLTVEQLWQPAVSAGVARVRVDARPSSSWRTVESYRILPSPDRARLLLPGSRNVLAVRALNNFRGLRPPLVNLQRRAIGGALTLGLPVATRRLLVQTNLRCGEPVNLPLASLARTLGVSMLHASIGVRLGANRKATLQLVDDDGAPAGFAKFGWSTATADLVRAEADALRQVGGRGGRVRAPTLLVEGVWMDRPYLVTSPLPETSRGLRVDAAAPTPQELAAVFPVIRMGRAADTGHLRRLEHRLRTLPGVTGSAETVVRSQRILANVYSHRSPVPVAARWHGDLTPWNAARDGEGNLWCWDWESSEPDVVAGLDSIHWSLSVRRERGERVDGASLMAALEDASPQLFALGLDPEGRRLVGAIYALTVAERACSLAADAGGWQQVWIAPERLAHMLASAQSLLEE